MGRAKLRKLSLNKQVDYVDLNCGVAVGAIVHYNTLLLSNHLRNYRKAGWGNGWVNRLENGVNLRFSW